MMKPEPSKQRAMCLWLPSWPLQRLRQARAELKRRELVLYGKVRGGLRVVAASKYPPGTPLAEVISGHVEEHDPAADHAALVQLATECEQFSPTVGIEPPDNLCLEVGGVATLFGGEELLMELVLRTFARRGLQARAAIADTLGAAWALAHSCSSYLVAPPGTLAIADLPVAALRLSEDVAILAELGIERIGQLLAMPRDTLASRFSPRLLLRLDQATGLVPEPILSHRPPPDIVLETRLEYPVGERDAISLLLGQLLERACRTLVERQQGAVRIEWTLTCERKTVTLQVGLYRASAQARHLLELTQLQLERLSLPGPVMALQLAVLLAAPLQCRQVDLFESSEREGRRQVGLLVDRLSNRLGRANVLRALPRAEAQPELAVRYEPLAGVMPKKSKTLEWKKLPRPLRLETEPLPLEVMAVAPDGPPIQFQFQGLQRVARAWGPERIQTGWWRGRYVQRDYYRIETSEGRRFWLFRRLADARWFLHGIFD